MPIYEYLCESCGNVFDELRQMVDSDVSIKCPECESNQTTRKLSLFFSHSTNKSHPQSNKACGSCNGKSCSTCH